MKKAINIPNIDMERYNIIKQQCKDFIAYSTANADAYEEKRLY